MIAVIDVTISARDPEAPLWPCKTYVGSPSSFRFRDVPRRIGNWNINSVQVQVTYPDGSVVSSACVLTGGIWVGTVAGTNTPGTSDFGYAVYASGTDENNNPVTGYCLGKGDVEVLDDAGKIVPGTHVVYATLFSSAPDEPKEGNIWESNGSFYVLLNGVVQMIGDDSGAIADLSAVVSALHPDYIHDSDGNKIEADGDFTYFDDTKWSVEIGAYGEYVLSPASTEEWTYAEAEGTEGNKKLVLQWLDYVPGWELKYYQWSESMLDWNLLAQGVTHDSPQATSLDIEISGDFTETAECRKGAPSTDKLATEGYVQGVVGDIGDILNVINGEVI